MERSNEEMGCAMRSESFFGGRCSIWCSMTHDGMGEVAFKCLQVAGARHVSVFHAKCAESSAIVHDDTCDLCQKSPVTLRAVMLDAFFVMSGWCTQTPRFRHRSGWSPCAHPVSKFFLWCIVFLFLKLVPPACRVLLACEFEKLPI